jgi:hypothetical protein
MLHPPPGGHARKKTPIALGVFHFVTDKLYLLAASFNPSVGKKSSPDLLQGSRAAMRETGFSHVSKGV